MVTAVRSSALLDVTMFCSHHWRLAPEDEPSLLRHLIRTRPAADREEGLSGSKDLPLAQARHESMGLAGARLPPGVIPDLEKATPPKHHHVRTVHVEGSPAKADAYISAKPLRPHQKHHQ